MSDYKQFEYNLEGLSFTVKVEIVDGVAKATISVTEGHADFNALYWGDDANDGQSATLSGKGDNALNMNGATYEGSSVDWDGVSKLSAAGLGKEGTDKATYLTAGESVTFSLTGLTSLDAVDFLGVRATSTSTFEGSIKAVDEGELVIDNPPVDHFPEWSEPAISHVTFYFDTDNYAGDTKGAQSVPGSKGPDGWFTVKFDVVGDNVSNDLDDWFDEALAFIAEQNPDLDLDSLDGVAIKGGQAEIYYQTDGDPYDGDPVPDVWAVVNNEVDQSWDVAYAPDQFIFA